MLITVKFKNNLSQVRTLPAISGNIVTVMNASPEIYSATGIKKDWYYIKELNGWAESLDLSIVEVIEPPTSDNDFNPETKPLPGVDSALIPNDVVNAINKASVNIDCAKVSYTEDGVEYPIYGIIRNLQQSLEDMRESIEKVNKMPAIPSLPQDVKNGTVLQATVSDDLATLIWKKLSYNNVDNIPEVDVISKNEF